jgi:hypothetical protein
MDRRLLPLLLAAPLLLVAPVAHAAPSVKLTFAPKGQWASAGKVAPPTVIQVDKLRTMSAVVLISGGTLGSVVPAPAAEAKYRVCIYLRLVREDGKGQQPGTCAEGTAVDGMRMPSIISNLSSIPESFVDTFKDGDAVEAWVEYEEGNKDGTLTANVVGTPIPNYTWARRGPAQLAKAGFKISIPKVTAPSKEAVTAWITEGMEKQKFEYPRGVGVPGYWSVSDFAAKFGQNDEKHTSRAWSAGSRAEMTYSGIVVGEPTKCTSDSGVSKCEWPVEAQIVGASELLTARPVIGPSVSVQNVPFVCHWVVKGNFDVNLKLSTPFWQAPECTKPAQ